MKIVRVLYNTVTISRYEDIENNVDSSVTEYTVDNDL